MLPFLEKRPRREDKRVMRESGKSRRISPGIATQGNIGYRPRAGNRLPAKVLPFALALALTAFASRPGWEKPPDAWSAEDVAALLHNSPWSIQAAAVMEDPEDTARDPTPAGPPDTGQKGVGATKPRWDGEPGHNRMGRLATIPVTVRWESALPIRQAEKESAAPATAYVISLTGLIPANRYRAAGKTETSSSSDGSFDARNPEEVLEAFMSYSKLVAKGSPDLQPENVKLDPLTGTVRIFFPRRPIDSDEKEVIFKTHFGGLNVKAKFHLSSMKYHGNIEL
jgi:hypothetical protein